MGKRAKPTKKPTPEIVEIERQAAGLGGVLDALASNGLRRKGPARDQDLPVNEAQLRHDKEQSTLEGVLSGVKAVADRLKTKNTLRKK